MKQFFQEDNGRYSMKRLCGLLCTIALCATMYHNQFSEEHFAPSPVLVEAVALLAFGTLGFTAVEKIFKKDKTQD
jgi:hypothetical protein